MKTNEPPILENLNKEDLDKIKIILDIQNLQDNGLSGFERFIKKKVVPLFLPFVTLMATIFFFNINLNETKKSKAIDRYKTEMDLVKMVWNDIKFDTNTTKFKNSSRFLVEMFQANNGYYKGDSILIGIGKNQRPIMILTRINPSMSEKVATIETNNTITAKAKEQSGEQQTPTVDPGLKSVVSLKPENLVKAVKKYADNKLTVYIQYSNETDKQSADKVADALKADYIVPPVDYVDNSKSGYQNEIRYYDATDLQTARNLALRLNTITGKNFQLVNIKSKAANTIEIWYDNKAYSLIPVTPKLNNTSEEKYKIIYNNSNYAAPGYFNQITDDIALYVDSYRDNEGARLRINGNTPFFLAKGAETLKEVNGYRITIRIDDYRRNTTFRKVVMYSIRIEKRE